MTSPKTPANENTPVPEAAEAQDNAAAQVPAPKEPSPEQEVARLKEELERMRDQWIRAVAETDNIRKRAQRDQEDTARYAVTNFARDMVNVLENLMRANATIPPSARK